MWPNGSRHAESSERVDDVRWTIAVDLAQGGSDWTALSVLESRVVPGAEKREHHVTHLERWRDVRTALVPARVTAVWQQLRALQADRDLRVLGRAPVTTPDISLVVDRTGVGPFGLDPLREAGFSPIGIALHGGDTTTPDELGFRLPKRDLAQLVQTSLQARRLQVVDHLPLAKTLRAELANFRPKFSPSGHDSYGAASGPEWREGAHDDMVLSVAMGLWYASRDPGTIEINPPALVAAMSRLMAME